MVLIGYIMTWNAIRAILVLYIYILLSLPSGLHLDLIDFQSSVSMLSTMYCVIPFAGFYSFHFSFLHKNKANKFAEWLDRCFKIIRIIFLTVFLSILLFK